MTSSDSCAGYGNDVPGPDYASDLDLASGLADVADAITRERFGALDLQVDAKPDLTPVSDADLAVERKVRTSCATSVPTTPCSARSSGAMSN